MNLFIVMDDATFAAGEFLMQDEVLLYIDTLPNCLGFDFGTGCLMT